MHQVANLSLWVGKHPVVIVIFTDWCNNFMNSLFYTQLNHIWNSKSIPLITWQLYQCNDISQPGIIKLVNNNTFDPYINQFSDRFKKWLTGNDGIYGTDDDRRAYLRLDMKFEMMSQMKSRFMSLFSSWNEWKLVSMVIRFNFKRLYYGMASYLYNIFSNKSLDSTRLQWVWCINNQDLGNYTARVKIPPSPITP